MKGRKLDSSQWFGPEGRNKYSARKNKKTRIQENEERLRNLWDISKCTNIQILGVPEEEEEQEIENFFEKIMKENLPSLVKEIRLLGNPGSSESPKEIGPKEAHTKAHHN